MDIKYRLLTHRHMLFFPPNYVENLFSYSYIQFDMEKRVKQAFLLQKMKFILVLDLRATHLIHKKIQTEERRENLHVLEDRSLNAS